MKKQLDPETGIHVVRKRLADGTIKEYTYTRGKKSSQKSGRYAPGTIGALLIAYRQSPEWRALKKTSQQNYNYSLRWLERLAYVPLAELKRKEIVALRDIVNGKSGPASAAVFVRVVSSLMTWAVDREWIEYNPASHIKTPRSGSWKAWTEADAHKAAAVLEEPLRRVIILGMYTGQRRADLCAMKWSSYDGTAIRLTQQKTGVSLVLPVHPALKTELDRWKRETASIFILTSLTGKPWNPASLTVRMTRQRKEAELSPNLNIHGLRKLAATLLAEAGCTTHEVAAITGHKTLAMVQHYTASASQEKLAKAAIARMETGSVNRQETGS